MVINLSLFKIQLENGELYKSSKGGRFQHYKSQEKAEAKLKNSARLPQVLLLSNAKQEQQQLR